MIRRKIGCLLWLTSPLVLNRVLNSKCEGKPVALAHELNPSPHVAIQKAEPFGEDGEQMIAKRAAA
jgi:hypothetical protein